MDSYIIHKFSKGVLKKIPTASIFFINNSYILEIISDTTSISIDILKEAAKTILYRILSYGVIPVDTRNGNRIDIIK